MRTAIRNQVKQIISDMARTEIKDILGHRLMNIDAQTQTPLVMVYFDEGSIEKKYLEGGKSVDALLHIEILSSDTLNVDSKLDIIGDAIELELEEPDHKTLNNLVVKHAINQFAYTRDDASPLATLTLTYALQYNY